MGMTSKNGVDQVFNTKPYARLCKSSWSSVCLGSEFIGMHDHELLHGLSTSMHTHTYLPQPAMRSG